MGKKIKLLLELVAAFTFVISCGASVNAMNSGGNGTSSNSSSSEMNSSSSEMNSSSSEMNSSSSEMNSNSDEMSSNSDEISSNSDEISSNSGEMSSNSNANNTGANNTGANNTGANNTGANNTGANNTGANNTGANTINTGANNTGANNTGANNTGANNTRSNVMNTRSNTINIGARARSFSVDAMNSRIKDASKYNYGARSSYILPYSGILRYFAYRAEKIQISWEDFISSGQNYDDYFNTQAKLLYRLYDYCYERSRTLSDGIELGLLNEMYLIKSHELNSQMSEVYWQIVDNEFIGRKREREPMDEPIDEPIDLKDTM